MKRGRTILVLGTVLTAACGAGGDTLAELLQDAGEMLVDAGAAMEDSGEAHAATDSGDVSSLARPGSDGGGDHDADVGGDGGGLTTPGTGLAGACDQSFKTHREFAGNITDVTIHYAVIETDRTVDDLVSAVTCGLTSTVNGAPRNPDFIPCNSATDCTETGAQPPLFSCAPAEVTIKGGKAYVRCGVTKHDEDDLGSHDTVNRYATARLVFAD